MQFVSARTSLVRLGNCLQNGGILFSCSPLPRTQIMWKVRSENKFDRIRVICHWKSLMAQLKRVNSFLHFIFQNLPIKTSVFFPQAYLEYLDISAAVVGKCQMQCQKVFWYLSDNWFTAYSSWDKSTLFYIHLPRTFITHFQDLEGSGKIVIMICFGLGSWLCLRLNKRRSTVFPKLFSSRNFRAS